MEMEMEMEKAMKIGKQKWGYRNGVMKMAIKIGNRDIIRESESGQLPK